MAGELQTTEGGRCRVRASHKALRQVRKLTTVIQGHELLVADGRVMTIQEENIQNNQRI